MEAGVEKARGEMGKGKRERGKGSWWGQLGSAVALRIIWGTAAEESGGGDSLGMSVV
jgi:hypothetical protein